MDWSGVDYLWIIVMFLSAVWTLILTAPIHCRGSTAEQVMECYISPNLMKKQTHPNLAWLEGVHIFSKFSFLGELFLDIMFIFVCVLSYCSVFPHILLSIFVSALLQTWFWLISQTERWFEMIISGNHQQHVRDAVHIIFNPEHYALILLCKHFLDSFSH